MPDLNTPEELEAEVWSFVEQAYYELTTEEATKEIMQLITSYGYRERLDEKVDVIIDHLNILNTEPIHTLRETLMQDKVAFEAELELLNKRKEE